MESVEGENAILNKLIIMDDVSGLADKSQEFFDSFKKIRFFVRKCFSYNISRKTKLGDDNVSDTYF